MAGVVAVPGTEEHARQLASHLGIDLITPEVRRFPDGELYVRIEQDLSGQDVVLFSSLYPEPAERFLTVAFLAGTARDRGARKVGLVAPYLAFMRQDDVFKPGEGVTSTYFARMVTRAFCGGDWHRSARSQRGDAGARSEPRGTPTRLRRR